MLVSCILASEVDTRLVVMAWFTWFGANFKICGRSHHHPDRPVHVRPVIPNAHKFTNSTLKLASQGHWLASSAICLQNWRSSTATSDAQSAKLLPWLCILRQIATLPARGLQHHTKTHGEARSGMCILKHKFYY
jgi:hypothetical protein